MATPTSDKLTQLFKLLEREPNDPFLLYGVGMEYRKLGALDDAIAYFDRAIAADARYCYAYYQRAQAFERKGDVERAKQSYRDGIAAARAAGDSHAQSELEAALQLLE